MNILGSGAVPVIKVTLTVHRIVMEGREMLISETRQGGRDFTIPMPKRLANSIHEGDLVTALCLPNPKLDMVYETFVLAKNSKPSGEGFTEVIFTRGRFWTDLWAKLGD